MQLFLRIPRVAEAFEYMVAAHEGQKYGDLPYFVHPLSVAEEVFNEFPDADEDTLIIALLHDVVEDTKFTLEDISARFGDNVAKGVDFVTKRPGSYIENVMRIVNSKFVPAIRVKWADNRKNMSGDKSHMEPERRDRLNKKYADSYMVLSAFLNK